jgi:hypothetical protein
MRNSDAHAAKSGLVPFPLRGPKSVRIALTAAVAGAIGLVPAVALTSPAGAAGGANANGAVAQATPTPSTSSSAPTLPVLTLTQTATDGNYTEGDDATYTVTAAGAFDSPITVHWDVVSASPLTPGHDQATPGQDFIYVANRTLTITPGGTNTATITIPLAADGLDENSEDYAVQLSAPNGATLNPDQPKIVSTIVDADSAPVLSVAPDTVTEGNTGKTTATFTAMLNPASGRTVTVHWATQAPASPTGATATAGVDYVAKSGTLTFGPGATTQTFSVDIIGDTIAEGDEEFDIAFTNSGGASLPDVNPVPVMITDDDAAPTVSFAGDVSMAEGNVTAPVTLQLKLSNPSSQDLHFDITDDSSPGGAGIASDTYSPGTPGSGDYTLLTPAVTIPAGQTTGYVVLLVNGDGMYESDETATITATNNDDTGSVTAGTALPSAEVQLTNDDAAPTLAINSVTVDEGDTAPVTGTVQGSADRDLTFDISVAGASVNGGTAADSSDFTSPASPLTTTIDAGTATGDTMTIGTGIVTTDDSDAEGAETIVVSGTPATGSVGSVTSGAITIAASDGGATTPPVVPTINVLANVAGAKAVTIAGTAAAGATVDLWGAPISAANAPLTNLGTTTASGTTGTGTYSFSRWIGQGYRFQVRVGDQMTTEKRVTVTQTPVFVASSTSKGVASFAVQGNPRGAGQTVVVQRYLGGKWVNVATGKTASTNKWMGSLKIASGTAVVFRSFVVGDTTMGILGGYSDTKRFKIK